MYLAWFLAGAATMILVEIILLFVAAILAAMRKIKNEN